MTRYLLSHAASQLCRPFTPSSCIQGEHLHAYRLPRFPEENVCSLLKDMTTATQWIGHMYAWVKSIKRKEMPSNLELSCKVLCRKTSCILVNMMLKKLFHRSKDMLHVFSGMLVGQLGLSFGHLSLFNVLFLQGSSQLL